MWPKPVRRVDIARSWEVARQQFDALLAEHHALNFRNKCELEVLREEIAELHSIISDVVATLRQEADQDVGQLRRELERALLRLAPHPGKPLN